MGAATRITVDPRQPDSSALQPAIAALQHGGLVIFPTETVYGLGVDVSNEQALARLLEVKERPENKPLTIHLGSADQLSDWGAQVDPVARLLMDRFWPGPLTIILPTERGPVGFRLPDHEVAKQLLRGAGCRVGASSANRAGEPAPTSVQDIDPVVAARVDVILDAGPSRSGKASTVVDATTREYRVLREGVVPESMIRQIVDSFQQPARQPSSDPRPRTKLGLQ